MHNWFRTPGSVSRIMVAARQALLTRSRRIRLAKTARQPNLLRRTILLLATKIVPSRSGIGDRAASCGDDMS